MFRRTHISILLLTIFSLSANAIPMIDVEKFTNGIDADVAGSGPLIAEGDAVLWSYRVTNTGDSALTNILLIDDNGTPGNLIDDF